MQKFHFNGLCGGKTGLDKADYGKRHRKRDAADTLVCSIPYIWKKKQLPQAAQPLSYPLIPVEAMPAT